MTRTVLDQWLQYCLVRQWGCVERSGLSLVHMMHFQGDCHFVFPLCKVLCGFSEFFFFSFFLAQNQGLNTGPNCERPGRRWAKIHNRLILYIYIYKSPWTQWRISKTVYKGILIMQVNKHDLKIKLIWSLIFWSLSAQRGSDHQTRFEALKGQLRWNFETVSTVPSWGYTLTLVTIFILIMTKGKSSLYNHYTIEAKQLTGSGERKAPTSKETKIRWLRISSHKK